MGKIVCSECGNEFEDSFKFCPNCGAKKIENMGKIVCSECGNEFEDSFKFCPNCGTSVHKTEPDKKDNFNNGASKTEKNIDASENTGNDKKPRGGRFIANKLQKSKAIDKVFDKMASVGANNMTKVDSSANRKLFEKTEPVFLEVFDSVDDEFIKTILLLEREKHNTVDGWGIVGAVATTMNTPTNGMSHDEAVQFYLDIVNNIKNEITKEKQEGIFDEEKFYKKKLKESSLSKLSF